MSRRTKVSNRSSSSKQWILRQSKDIYSRRARNQGHVSRAYYKIEEIDKRSRLITKDSWVLELGAAPGGWTSYIESKMQLSGSQGKLIACDSKPIQAGDRTHVVQGWFGDSKTVSDIEEILGPDKLDLVLSDMAPNITGIRVADQAASLELVDLATVAAEKWLRQGGSILVKAFQGEGFESFVRDIKNDYSTVQVIKPKSSRAESREIYVLARQFRG